MTNKDEDNKLSLLKELLEEKACLKQDVFDKGTATFKVFLDEVKKLTETLAGYITAKDPRVHIDFVSKNDFEAELRYGGDVLVFQLHSNVFSFDKSHFIWNSDYVREDEHRAYCVLINIYNFLGDSFKYGRTNDLGYLVGRIFVNKEGHYFMEGKRQMGFLFNDFPTAVFDEEAMNRVLHAVMLYTLDFDLLVPPYDTVKEVTVGQVISESIHSGTTTGKRLGFQFSADRDDMVH